MADVWLSVEDDDSGDGLAELFTWLGHDSGLRGRVKQVRPPMPPGVLGAKVEELEAKVDDRKTQVFLAHSLSDFLTLPRRTDMRIVLRDAGGRRAQLNKSNAADISNLIRTFATGTTSDRPGEALRTVDALVLDTLPGRSIRKNDSPPPRSTPSDSDTLAVTIYLADEGVHEQVEAAVTELLELAGLEVRHRDDPVLGSWFRRLWAGTRTAARSQPVREGLAIAAHAADTRLILAQDAAVTATLLQNLGPVITSLQPTKDAVVRLGAVLIVKIDWTVTVYQLTAAQQFDLDHQPKLAVSPQEIVAALNARPAEESELRP